MITRGRDPPSTRRDRERVGFQRGAKHAYDDSPVSSISPASSRSGGSRSRSRSHSRSRSRSPQPPTIAAMISTREMVGGSPRKTTSSSRSARKPTTTSTHRQAAKDMRNIYALESLRYTAGSSGPLPSSTAHSSGTSNKEGTSASTSSSKDANAAASSNTNADGTAASTSTTANTTAPATSLYLARQVTCECSDCVRLNEFLRSQKRGISFDAPSYRRSHIHNMINDYIGNNLVSHQSRWVDGNRTLYVEKIFDRRHEILTRRAEQVVKDRLVAGEGLATDTIVVGGLNGKPTQGTASHLNRGMTVADQDAINRLEKHLQSIHEVPGHLAGSAAAGAEFAPNDVPSSTAPGAADLTPAAEAVAANLTAIQALDSMLGTSTETPDGDGTIAAASSSAPTMNILQGPSGSSDSLRQQMGDWLRALKFNSLEQLVNEMRASMAMTATEEEKENRWPKYLQQSKKKEKKEGATQPQQPQDSHSSSDPSITLPPFSRLSHDKLVELEEMLLTSIRTILHSYHSKYLAKELHMNELGLIDPIANRVRIETSFRKNFKSDLEAGVIRQLIVKEMKKAHERQERTNQIGAGGVRSTSSSTTVVSDSKTSTVGPAPPPALILRERNEIKTERLPSIHRESTIDGSEDVAPMSPRGRTTAPIEEESSGATKSSTQISSTKKSKKTNAIPITAAPSSSSGSQTARVVPITLTPSTLSDLPLARPSTQELLRSHQERARDLSQKESARAATTKKLHQDLFKSKAAVTMAAGSGAAPKEKIGSGAESARAMVKAMKQLRVNKPSSLLDAPVSPPRSHPTAREPASTIATSTQVFDEGWTLLQKLNHFATTTAANQGGYASLKEKNEDSKEEFKSTPSIPNLHLSALTTTSQLHPPSISSLEVHDDFPSASATQRSTLLARQKSPLTIDPNPSQPAPSLSASSSLASLDSVSAVAAQAAAEADALRTQITEKRRIASAKRQFERQLIARQLKLESRYRRAIWKFLDANYLEEKKMIRQEGVSFVDLFQAREQESERELKEIMGRKFEEEINPEKKPEPELTAKRLHHGALVPLHDSTSSVDSILPPQPKTVHNDPSIEFELQSLRDKFKKKFLDPKGYLPPSSTVTAKATLASLTNSNATDSTAPSTHLSFFPSFQNLAPISVRSTQHLQMSSSEISGVFADTIPKLMPEPIILTLHADQCVGITHPKLSADVGSEALFKESFYSLSCNRDLERRAINQTLESQAFSLVYETLEETMDVPLQIFLMTHEAEEALDRSDEEDLPHKHVGSSGLDGGVASSRTSSQASMSRDRPSHSKRGSISMQQPASPALGAAPTSGPNKSPSLGPMSAHRGSIMHQPGQSGSLRKGSVMFKTDIPLGVSATSIVDSLAKTERRKQQKNAAREQAEKEEAELIAKKSAAIQARLEAYKLSPFMVSEDEIERLKLEEEAAALAAQEKERQAEIQLRLDVEAKRIELRLDAEKKRTAIAEAMKLMANAPPVAVMPSVKDEGDENEKKKELFEQYATIAEELGGSDTEWKEENRRTLARLNGQLANEDAGAEENKQEDIEQTTSADATDKKKKKLSKRKKKHAKAVAGESDDEESSKKKPHHKKKPKKHPSDKSSSKSLTDAAEEKRSPPSKPLAPGEEAAWNEDPTHWLHEGEHKIPRPPKDTSDQEEESSETESDDEGAKTSSLKKKQRQKALQDKRQQRPSQKKLPSKTSAKSLKRSGSQAPKETVAGDLPSEVSSAWATAAEKVEDTERANDMAAWLKRQQARMQARMELFTQMFAPTEGGATAVVEEKKVDEQKQLAHSGSKASSLQQAALETPPRTPPKTQKSQTSSPAPAPLGHPSFLSSLEASEMARAAREKEVAYILHRQQVHDSEMAELQRIHRERRREEKQAALAAKRQMKLEAKKAAKIRKRKAELMAKIEKQMLPTTIVLPPTDQALESSAIATEPPVVPPEIADSIILMQREADEKFNEDEVSDVSDVSLSDTAVDSDSDVSSSSSSESEDDEVANIRFSEGTRLSDGAVTAIDSAAQPPATGETADTISSLPSNSAATAGSQSQLPPPPFTKQFTSSRLTQDRGYQSLLSATLHVTSQLLSEANRRLDRLQSMTVGVADHYDPESGQIIRPLSPRQLRRKLQSVIASTPFGTHVSLDEVDNVTGVRRKKIKESHMKDIQPLVQGFMLWKQQQMKSQSSPSNQSQSGSNEAILPGSPTGSSSSTFTALDRSSMESLQADISAELEAAMLDVKQSKKEAKKRKRQEKRQREMEYELQVAAKLEQMDAEFELEKERQQQEVEKASAAAHQSSAASILTASGGIPPVSNITISIGGRDHIHAMTFPSENDQTLWYEHFDPEQFQKDVLSQAATEEKRQVEEQAFLAARLQEERDRWEAQEQQRLAAMNSALEQGALTFQVTLFARLTELWRKLKLGAAKERGMFLEKYQALNHAPHLLDALKMHERIADAIVQREKLLEIVFDFLRRFPPTSARFREMSLEQRKSEEGYLRMMLKNLRLQSRQLYTWLIQLRTIYQDVVWFGVEIAASPEEGIPHIPAEENVMDYLQKLSLDFVVIQAMRDKDSQTGERATQGVTGFHGDDVLNFPPNDSLVSWTKSGLRDLHAMPGYYLQSVSSTKSLRGESTRRPGTGGIIQLEAPRAVPLLLSYDEQQKLDLFLEHQWEYRTFVKQHQEQLRRDGKVSVRSVGHFQSHYQQRHASHQQHPLAMKQVYLSMDDEYQWQIAQSQEAGEQGAGPTLGGGDRMVPMPAWEDENSVVQQQHPNLTAMQPSQQLQQHRVGDLQQLVSMAQPQTTSSGTVSMHPFAQHLKAPDNSYGVNPNPQVSRARRVQRLRTMNLPQMSIVSVNHYYNALSRLMAGMNEQQHTVTVTHTRTQTQTTREEISYGVIGKALPQPNVASPTAAAAQTKFQPSLTLAAIAQSAASKSLPFNQSIALSLPLSTTTSSSLYASESNATYRVLQQQHREKLQLKTMAKQQQQQQKKHASKPADEKYHLLQHQFHFPQPVIQTFYGEASPTQPAVTEFTPLTGASAVDLQQLDDRRREVEAQFIQQQAAIHSPRHRSPARRMKQQQQDPELHGILDQSVSHPQLDTSRTSNQVISPPVLNEMLQVGQQQELAIRQYERLKEGKETEEDIMQQQMQLQQQMQDHQQRQQQLPYQQQQQQQQQQQHFQQQQAQRPFYFQQHQQQQFTSSSYNPPTIHSPQAGVPFLPSDRRDENHGEVEAAMEDENQTDGDGEQQIHQLTHTIQTETTTTETTTTTATSTGINLSRVVQQLAAAIDWANKNRFPVTERKSTRKKRRKEAKKGQAPAVPKRMKMPETISSTQSEAVPSSESTVAVVPSAETARLPPRPPTQPPSTTQPPFTARTRRTAAEIDAAANAAFERRWQQKKAEMLGAAATIPRTI